MLEQVTWRGCRHGGEGIGMSAADEHLQTALQAEGVRAAHDCYAVAMPLAVPLPFPRFFAPGLSPQGDQVRLPRMRVTVQGGMLITERGLQRCELRGTGRRVAVDAHVQASTSQVWDPDNCHACRWHLGRRRTSRERACVAAQCSRGWRPPGGCRACCEATPRLCTARCTLHGERFALRGGTCSTTTSWSFASLCSRMRGCTTT